MEDSIKKLIEVIFGLSLFFNAFVFIPQAIRIYRKKHSQDLSIFTFVGFNLMQFFTVLHAYFAKDYLLLLGFLLSLITCGIVTTLIFLYRKNI